MVVRQRLGAVARRFLLHQRITCITPAQRRLSTVTDQALRGRSWWFSDVGCETGHMASEATQALLSVASDLGPVFRDHGYRKHRLTFRRAVSDGIDHVVDLQPGKQHLHGRFTVNLGVYIREAEPKVDQFPDIARAFYAPGKHPQLRQRLGHLLPEGEDMWWPLDQPRLSASEVAHALEAFGFPWLARLGDVDQVLEVLESSPLPDRQYNAPIRLVAMRIRLANGDRVRAELDFADHVAFEMSRGISSGHSEYLARIAAAEHFDVAVPHSASD